MFGVFGSCRCTTTWCTCTYGNSATTSWNSWGDYYAYTTTWTVAVPKLNKALRWFDCFRGSPPPPIPALLVAIEAVRRYLQPVNAAERRRQKRKQFIQRLTRAAS